MNYYTLTLNLCGITRKLTLVHVSKKTQRANLSILGDVELVDILADTLVNQQNPYKSDFIWKK